MEGPAPGTACRHRGPSSRTAALIARPFRERRERVTITRIQSLRSEPDPHAIPNRRGSDALRLGRDGRLHRPERHHRPGRRRIPNLAGLARPADVADGVVRGVGDREHRLPDLAAMTLGCPTGPVGHAGSEPLLPVHHGIIPASVALRC